jgi:hypothetical protein
MYSGKLLMIGRGTALKHVEFLDKNKFGKISASVGFIKKKFVTLHGHMNVK